MQVSKCGIMQKFRVIFIMEALGPYITVIFN